MGLDNEYITGQTPLDEDEKEGLLIKFINTRDDLNGVEQQNIEEAILWTLKRNFKPDQVFTEVFIKDLHKRMFGQVWSWAGAYRKTNKNIGVDKWEIPVQVNILLQDALFWIRHQTFEPDELAIHFKHRLVSIHCFANGNGRHSRLMADIIVSKLFGRPVFTWGAFIEPEKPDVRQTYLEALRNADKGDLKSLVSFGRQ